MTLPCQSPGSPAQEILEFLQKEKDTPSPLLILTHDYPDPDALASAFALHYLAQLCCGIHSRIAYGGVIGRRENREMVRILRMPVHRLRPGDFTKYEHVALVDTQPGFGNNSFPEGRKAHLVIDQHPFVTCPAADLVVLDPDCGATSAILAQALIAQNQGIPVRVATALAYGIISDTLDLYRVKRSDTVQTYLTVLHHSDLRALARIQNPPHSRRFFKTLAKGINKAVVQSRLIVSHLGWVENPDLVSQTADFLLTYQGMRWSLCTGRYNAKLHVSFRIAKTNAFAGEILRDIFRDPKGAGGHDNIAGGSFEIGKDESEAIWVQEENGLQERLVKRLKLSSRGGFFHPFRPK